MKIRIQLVSILSAATLLLTSNVSMADNVSFFGNPADGRWMVGLKGMRLSTDFNGYDDATNIGLVLGYHFARPVGDRGSAAIEFEFSDTTSEGDIDASSRFGTAGEWDASTTAIYFSYRTPGTIYFMGKLGGIHSKVNSAGPGFDLREKDTALAYGAGFGLRLGKNEQVNIEIEYVGSSGDNDISMINLGAMVLF